MAREQRGASYSVVTIKTMLVPDVWYAKESKCCRWSHNPFTHNPFTHKHFCTQTILHTGPFAHNDFYTEALLHTDVFTHRRFDTQTLLRTNTLNADAFTHKHFYIKAIVHRPFDRTNQTSKKTSVLDTRTSFRAKGLPSDQPNSQKPSAFDTRFVPKGCRRRM